MSSISFLMNDLILVAQTPAETTGKAVGVIKINRPNAMNALSQPLIDQLLSAVKSFDSNDEIGAIVITGSERVFAGSPKLWDTPKR